MAKFWLDTSVFITAASGNLAFDLRPEFWETLESDAKNDLIASPMFVYREIVDLSGRDDELARWALRMKAGCPLFVEPDESSVDAFTQIANYVHQFADPSEGDEFLNVADPWVIAHALAGGTVVVSEEKLVGQGSKRLAIPNVCEYFSVGCVKTDRFLRELKEERG
jgi:hypothetical protein